jgi:two-component system sensor kinase FixL
MNTIQVVWLMVIGACVMLALLQLLVRGGGRAAPWVALLALSIAGIVTGELALMHAPDPQAFGRTVRWMQVPIYTAYVAIIGYIHWSFGSGRRWLGVLVLLLRVVWLGLNFLHDPDPGHVRSSGLREIRFLGEPAQVAEAVFNRRTWLAGLSTILLLVYMIDASWRLWRKQDADSRRRGLLMGGGVALFIAISLVQGILIHTGTVAMPYLISLPFCVVLAMMAYEGGRDVRRSAAMATALRENAESMQLVANTARISFWQWNIADDSIRVNPHGSALYGVPEHEPVNLARLLSTLHPDDRETTRRALDDALAGDGNFGASYRVLLADGSRRWIEASGKIDFDGRRKPLHMCGVSIDVTERQMMHERFRLIVEASPNGVVLANAGGTILMTNQRAEGMFGFGPGELVGMPVDRLVPERFRHSHAAYRDRFHQAPTSRAMGARRELFALRKDGSEFPVEIGISPVESTEGTVVLSVIVDISARRQAEEEARRHRDELAHVTRVTTLSELSGSLAHELNQPLAIILANAQAAQRLLTRSPPDLDEVKDILSDIVDEDRRAGEVIQRLRALLKRGETKILPVSLNDIATEVLHLTHADLIGRGVTVTRNLAEELPPVSGDRVQLQQVLLNLILNGADAMSRKPPRTRDLLVSTSATNGFVRLSVSDTGTGLPGDIEELFQPFYTTKSHGLGMGLAICRSIMTAHGGRLRARPNPDGGAIFEVELPAGGLSGK